MRSYLRTRVAGGLYFFTLVLANRQGNRLLVEQAELLRAAFRRTQSERPFAIVAMVVLPDHLHCLWRMPDGDSDFSTRWRLIKSRFTRALPPVEAGTRSRRKKRERVIWQRRFREHLIRDEEDFRRHLDYIHFNPVKHGYASRPADWPYSTFRRWVERGVYALEWGG